MIRFNRFLLAALAAAFAGRLAAADGQPAGAPKFKASIAVGAAKEAEYPALAKVGLQKAIATALKEVKGPIMKVQAELENENGLIYSVEACLADGNCVEVNVDAGDGKVLQVTQDDGAPGKDEAPPEGAKEDGKDKAMTEGPKMEAKDQAMTEGPKLDAKDQAMKEGPKLDGKDQAKKEEAKVDGKDKDKDDEE